MNVRFAWRWVSDDTGDHVRVVQHGDQEPGEAEVCRLVPGRADDWTGCILRAMIVCDALTLLAGTQAGRTDSR